MVTAIIKELHQRYRELENDSLDSIYFGGGTPSLLSGGELEQILDTISSYWSWTDQTEVTLEANPDDLDLVKLQELKAAGINRLSIGIQSFDEADLKFMNRAHDASEASRCIDLAVSAGFDRLSADLIFGSPTTTDEIWSDNVQKMLAYDLDHISAYCLTVEEGTALQHKVKTGKEPPVQNDRAIAQFDHLIKELGKSGYDHYEISNYAKPGKYAIHNTNYWRGKPYLGVGPTAHSYNGKATRRWNIAHNMQYITKVATKEKFWESEKLSQDDQYNEYIMTSLRTMWGADQSKLIRNFSDQWAAQSVTLDNLIADGLLKQNDDVITLTLEGKYLADNVAMQLFV